MDVAEKPRILVTKLTEPPQLTKVQSSSRMLEIEGRGSGEI